MGRGNRSKDREPPLWETPERLFGIDAIRTMECEDAERPAGIKGNPSHMLLGTADMLHGYTSRALDFAGDVLDIRSEGPWRWQRSYLADLLRLFYDEGSDAPAWMSVIPLRYPHEHRFAGQRIRAVETAHQPRAVGTETGLRRGSLHLHHGIGEMDTRKLLLGYEQRERGAKPYLLRQKRERTLEGGAFGDSYDTMFYFGHPAADEDRISRAHIPAMQPYYDQRLRLLRTAGIVLAKMGRGPDSDVTQIIVTLQPEDGRTAALVSGERSLETLMHQYPIDATMLNEGVRL